MKKLVILITLASILIWSPIPANAKSASFDVNLPSLKYGYQGGSVEVLQQFLESQGVYTGTIDGKFGYWTVKAVKDFQIANGLSADGIFGLESKTKANSIIEAIVTPDPIPEQSQPTPTVCPPGDLFSVVTGQPCNSSTPDSNLPVGCVSISGYSSVTGQKCDGTTNTPVNENPIQEQLPRVSPEEPNVSLQKERDAKVAVLEQKKISLQQQYETDAQNLEATTGIQAPYLKALLFQQTTLKRQELDKQIADLYKEYDVKTGLLLGIQPQPTPAYVPGQSVAGQLPIATP